MKLIPLTQGKYAMVDDEDYERLMSFKWCFDGVYAATNIKGIKRRKLRMHRFVLGLTDSKIFCDHKDHNSLNNQKENLRIVNNAQNICNSRSRRNSVSKFLGVCWHYKNKKWIAQITKDYKNKYIGSFDDEIQAAIAYNQEAVKLHGEFANLNTLRV